MLPELMVSADWHEAQTLNERLTLATPAVPVTERGRGRLAAWKDQSPFEDAAMFSRRLAASGASEPDWLTAFSLTTDELASRQRETPPWLRHLRSVYAGSVGTESDPGMTPNLDRRGPLSGFLALARPLIEDGCRRLQIQAAARWDNHPDLPFDVSTCAALLLSYLPERLLEMCSRTLVLELHVARLQEGLQGETPEARFRSFVTRLEKPEVARQLLAEYPVLARRMAAAVDTWIAGSLSFLQDLVADHAAIAAQFGGDPGKVCAVAGGAGDAHRGGRTVQIVTFASGLRLVYKPRSLAVDVHFQDFLRWCNDRDATPDFPILQVLDRGDRGWQAFIEAKPCDGEEHIARFYERVGAFLALFHLLDATDFHFENLIAHGEYPYPVDLETLFHPRLAQPHIDLPDVRITHEAVSTSVLRVGILPFRIGELADNPGVDVSGLASVAGQMSPDAILQWQDTATDEMRADRRRVPLPAGKNRPKFSDRDADTLAFADRIVAGFTRTWRLLQSHREQLWEVGGPLTAFEQDQIRAVLRPTRAYHLILAESFHPDLLRDGLRLDRHFDRLWSGLEDRPQLLAVVDAERDDLAKGDIPFFTTRPGSRDLWTSGGERIADFFQTSPLAAVRARIDDWDEEHLRRQTWFIEAALGTLALSRDDLDWPSYAMAEPAALPDAETLQRRLTSAATKVADRLEALAFQAEGEVTWIGLTFANDRWSLVTLMEDLYSGTPGIILFLAQMGAITSSARHTDLAKAATATLRRRLVHTGQDIKTPGLFQGWGSLVFLFTRLGTLWRDERLLADAERFLENLEPTIDNDENLDLIGGVAGSIAALLCLHRATSSPRALALAVRCGDVLLAHAKVTLNGIAWPTPIGDGTPLLGFSHGTAGIANALFALAEACGEERFHRNALEAWHFEHVAMTALRNQNEEEKAQRRPGEVQALAVAWCYGSAGVGISRLRALRSTFEVWLRRDLDEALQQTLDDGFGRNHCLCHGDLGNLDFLLQARDQLGSPQLERQCRRLATIILESMETNGFRCGTPLCAESPGMMNGLAGIGYGLLRAAYPDRVPSILACDPG